MFCEQLWLAVGRLLVMEQAAGKYTDGTDSVIAAMIEVHRCLGPGLLESAYEPCRGAELALRGIRF